MTPHRRYGEPRPFTGEAPFRVREVFFSRTDACGIITSGNEVFQRVADHPWDKLIGAPHRIIRHEDMPRGVFWLLWDRIAQGKPTGAYIKNRARDGLYYWVFAIVTPIEDGYLSVRLKPTSPLLKLVQQEYASLLSAEATGASSAEDDGHALLARLTEMGFATYDRFMAQALATEINARATAMDQPANKALAQFAHLASDVGRVTEITRELSATFAAIRCVPTNMRILASRLEAAGGPISVISANYSIMSDDITAWTDHFMRDSNSAFGRIGRALDTGMFLQGAALIQDEALAQFRNERRNRRAFDKARQGADSDLLERQAAYFRDSAQAGLDRITSETERFSHAVVDMKRLVTGLSSTRMMCKIEAARLREGRDSLDEIIRQLDSFQVRVEHQLARLREVNQAVQSGATRLRLLTT